MAPSAHQPLTEILERRIHLPVSAPLVRYKTALHMPKQILAIEPGPLQHMVKTNFQLQSTKTLSTAQQHQQSGSGVGMATAHTGTTVLQH
mmetsp:Transcript_27789/g.50153  ORF Transcript_27789/g.50153 Transcript_27789/m.50153 type:complete len:90 (+) Transcript_27789:166-435(+)